MSVWDITRFPGFRWRAPCVGRQRFSFGMIFFSRESPTSDRRVRTERGSWPVYREGIDSDSVPCRWHSPCKWCRAVAGGELCYYCGALTEPATATLSKATRPATICYVHTVRTNRVSPQTNSCPSHIIFFSAHLSARSFTQRKVARGFSWSDTQLSTDPREVVHFRRLPKGLSRGQVIPTSCNPPPANVSGIWPNF